MQIGLDFDGVTAHTYAMKVRIAEEVLGKQVSLRDVSYERCTQGTSLLTLEEWEQIQWHNIHTEMYTHELEPVRGALLGIEKLLSMGHDIKIITGRAGEPLQWAQHWLARQDVSESIMVEGVGYRQSKARAALGLDVFVDDDAHYLKDLPGIVPHLYFFGWEYNEDQRAPGAQRIGGWRTLLHEIESVAHTVDLLTQSVKSRSLTTMRDDVPYNF